MGQDVPERLYSAYQLADLLGVLPSEVTAWIQRGALPFQDCPDGSPRIPEHALVAFLKQRGFDLRLLLGQSESGGGNRAGDAADNQRRIEVRALGSARPEQSDAGERGRRVDDAEVIDAEVRADEPAAAATASDAPAEPPMPIDLPATQIIDAIIQEAVRRQVGAVHLEESASGLQLRLRIGQELRTKPHFAQRLPRAMQLRLLERLQQLAGMQDGQARGRFVRRVGHARVEASVSALAKPTGWQFVLELLVNS